MAELKISDLSVGDWIQIDEGSTPVSIKSIHSGSGQDYVIVNDNFYEEGIIVFAYDVKPIPITPEILEKNGWSADGMYAILRIDEHLHLEYYYHEHRLRKYYCGKDEWQNHAKVNDITFAAHCYSIHQLQHAMRLAGVDKEINL